MAIVNDALLFVSWRDQLAKQQKIGKMSLWGKNSVVMLVRKIFQVKRLWPHIWDPTFRYDIWSLLRFIIVINLFVCNIKTGWPSSVSECREDMSDRAYSLLS